MLNCLEMTLQEDVSLEETGPELAAHKSKWAWCREGLNFKRFFVSAYSKLLDVCIRVYKESLAL